MAFDIPRGADDLLLHFGKPPALLTLLLALLILVLLVLVLSRFAFAKNFLEVTYFREVHIAGGSAVISVRPDIIGPEVIRQKLIRLCAELFQCQQMFERLFFL